MQAKQSGGDDEIKDLERELEEQTILIFRKIAHFRVEKAKRTAVAASTPTSQTSSIFAWESWSSWWYGTKPETKDEAVEKILSMFILSSRQRDVDILY